MNDLEQYQIDAMKFADFKHVAYPLLGLPEEVGEFLRHFAKLYRGDYDKVDLDDVLKEAGDVLWQLTACLDTLGLTLAEAAQMNIEKLTDRKARDVIKGSGDHR
jgi:NTP pyrophosphatase (non-canonical NTP hydrolase)